MWWYRIIELIIVIVTFSKCHEHVGVPLPLSMAMIFRPMAVFYVYTCMYVSIFNFTSYTVGLCVQKHFSHSIASKSVLLPIPCGSCEVIVLLGISHIFFSECSVNTSLITEIALGESREIDATLMLSIIAAN